MAQIEHIRIPDEILLHLDAICERFPKIASINDENGISLRNLTTEERLTLDLISVIGPVDEIIDNINMVISDLELLGNSSRSFGDNHPFRRYKLLVRLFFYEYARFRDTFAQYLMWLQRKKYIERNQRKEALDAFNARIKPMLDIRNICIHKEIDWSKHVTPEIGILTSLDLFGLQVANKDGEILKWEPHLAPRCAKMIETMIDSTSEIRTMWNMQLSICVQLLISDGKLKPATKRRTPKNLVRDKVRSHFQWQMPN